MIVSFRIKFLSCSSLLLLATLTTGANEQSIIELMTTRVAPATDTLWGADDPQTDADWQLLDDAASETIEAFIATKAGGAGPNDNNWAANNDWQAFADDVIAAAELAKLAIGERDIEALWEAGDPLYTPCEACHLVYNPGVAEQ
jgi:hypothetical protein